MEADFQRDYGMDLGREMDALSWRRFSVLVHNLSPDGALAREMDKAREEGMDGESAAESFFRGMTAFSPKQGDFRAGPE